MRASVTLPEPCKAPALRIAPNVRLRYLGGVGRAWIGAQRHGFILIARLAYFKEK